MNTVSIMELLVVVIHCPSELLIVWKYIGIIETHLLVGASSTFIQNTHHPYISLLTLRRNQFTICGHDNHFIVRFFHGKDIKINDVKFPRKACLCVHLLVSHVKLNYLTIDEFGSVSSFLNQLSRIKPTLLQRYNGFHHTEDAIKYNHPYIPK